MWMYMYVGKMKFVRGWLNCYPKQLKLNKIGIKWRNDDGRCCFFKSVILFSWQTHLNCQPENTHWLKTGRVLFNASTCICKGHPQWVLQLLNSNTQCEANRGEMWAELLIGSGIFPAVKANVKLCSMCLDTETLIFLW